MEPGLLTKVFNDFFTTVDGELSLSKGDYFLVRNCFHKCIIKKSDFEQAGNPTPVMKRR